jgi:hypothetical protein
MVPSFLMQTDCPYGKSVTTASTLLSRKGSRVASVKSRDPPARFLRLPAIMDSSKSLPAESMPMSPASMRMPPVPQNGSSRRSPSFAQERLTRVRAIRGIMTPGWKNARFPGLRQSNPPRSIPYRTRPK